MNYGPLLTIFFAFNLINMISVAIGTSTDDLVNNRPIIGVLAQSCSSKAMKQLGDTYIAASYIKFIESSGARAVPILINQPDDYYQMMFSSLNGVLFPGGGSDGDLVTSGYGMSGKHFFDLAIEYSNKADDYFPIWGTCLGMELLTELTAGESLLTFTDAQDTAYPLIFARDAQDSRLFGRADPSITKILSAQNVTYNNHHLGLTPTNFSKNAALRSFYRVLSTDIDGKGLQFISTMEAINYPIYGVQFHPEKNCFEWESQNIPHSQDAVQIEQYFANFLVAEARKSSHKFKNAQVEEQYVIFNQSPVYTRKISSFEQCYFF